MQYCTQLLVSQTKNNLILKAFSGSEARKYSKQMASIYVNMFKKFPYLYESTIAECEKNYLESYFISKHNKVLLLFKDEQIVGVSAGLPIDEVEGLEIKSALSKKQIDTSKYFYVGGTVIEYPFRSLELIREISKRHEIHAKNNGYSRLVFITVRRHHSHPSRPLDYRSLEPIWQHLGYNPIEGIEIRDKWKQTDTHQEEENCLDLWSKPVSKAVL